MPWRDLAQPPLHDANMNTSVPPRILVVDDDHELTGMLREYLQREGFAVEVEPDGAQALARIGQGCDLVILDVMLPGRSGLDVLRTLRGRENTPPVLMLTARGDDVDRIVGLELGADDYLPKPFNPRELVARMRAVLRRAADRPAPGEALTLGRSASMRPGTAFPCAVKPCSSPVPNFACSRS
jgi:DNA-binding response OmpR family regulator